MLMRWLTGRLDAIASNQSAALASLKSLHTKIGTIVATLSEVQASQAAEDAEIKLLIDAAKAAQASLADMSAQVDALKAQIAAGSGVSAADLDALKADMDAQKAAMEAALAPPAPAAPAP